MKSRQAVADHELRAQTKRLMLTEPLRRALESRYQLDRESQLGR